MRRVTRNGVIVVAAASGAMAVTMPVYADSGAAGAAAGVPGVLAGNTVQLPVHAPVNLCGNTVNVVGLLNPAAGNGCADEDVTEDGGGNVAEMPDGATANSGGKDSPGVLSGNNVQLPVHLPTNVTGNSVSVVGVGNAAVGNESDTSEDGPEKPERPTPETTPPPRADPAPETAPSARQPHFTSELADTGTDRTLPALAGSAALVLGGAVVYRRFRPRPTR